jgi:ABC-2 type transport system permease protein
LVLRRDRVRLPIWVASIGGLVAISAASLQGVYPTRQDLLQYAEVVRGNAAMTMQSGPGHGLDDPTLGAVLVNETALWAAVSVALMAVLLVGRHTRAEEEGGRADLLRSNVVGRHAAIAAAATTAVGAALAVGVAVALGAWAADLPVAGSVAFGVAVAGVGVTFTGIALVAAQVTTTARGASAIGVGALALSFVLRAIGDVGGGTLSWLSPIGWAQAVRPFADERWWALTLPLVAFGVCAIAAVRLADHRDLGAGLVQQRPGPAEGSDWGSSPLGLALRLQRGSLIGWCVGLLVLGVFYGAVADEAEAMMGDNPELQSFLAQVGGASIVDAFLSTALLLLALIASGFAVAAALRPRAEEMAGRAESILTAGASRWAWMGSQLTVAVVGTVAVVAAAGLGAGLGYGVAAGAPGAVTRLTLSSLALVPAVLVLVGIAAALVGWLPRAAPLAWGVLAGAAVLGVLSELLGVPDWLRQASPFEHAPAVPAEAVTWVPLLVQLTLAAVLVVAGLVGFRRRDLTT